MIKNGRQYKITKAQARQFRATLKALQGQTRPKTTSPRIWQAQFDAIQSQCGDLEEDVRNYESLLSVRPAVIEVRSLEEIPRALIQARIALDLSQKALAERMGLKEQQVQRYEATDYSTATLTRLIEVANALGVRISESVFLPQAKLTKSALIERLGASGISYEFLAEKLLPADIVDALEELSDDGESVAIVEASKILRGIYGWEINDLCGVHELQFPSAATATARFKIPAGQRGKSLSGYVVYANYLALVVANASTNLNRVPLPDNPSLVRSTLLKRGPEIDLRAVLEFLWESGIPVLPLSDAGNFHGACWRVGGRNVIVAKQRSPYASRWAFDLLHEFHHACQNPSDSTHSWIEGSDLASLGRVSLEEQEANRFAGEVLLDGRAEELVEQCVELARGNIRNLKAAVPEVAQREGVATDHLANYMAYRLSLQKENWWGTAAKLQQTSENPFELACQIFLERFNFGQINSLDARILQRAIATDEN